MKLDLFNSRATLLPDTGCRIYDSIEGNFIDKPPLKPKDIIKASFKSKAPRIDTKAIDTKFDKIPDRFDQDQLDRYGRSMRTKKLQSLKSLDTTGVKTAVEVKAESQSAYFKDLEEKFPSLRLDYKKDQIYDVKYETIKRRVSEGQVAGGVFPLQGRKDDPPLYKVGPGDYEVYDSPTVIGGTFGLQPVDRGFDEVPNPEYFPLKERKRLKRIHAQQEKRKADNKTRFHIDCTKDIQKDSSSSSSNAMVPSGSGAVTFNAIRRFDNRFYKQEPYVKTSGLILDGNYDKKFDKKIKFSFDTHDTIDDKRRELLSMFKSEGADVDVDVDHIFSIAATAARSPIKYSASFRWVTAVVDGIDMYIYNNNIAVVIIIILLSLFSSSDNTLNIVQSMSCDEM